ncbi:MAG: hypothetical protein N2690_10325, partial [Rhodocyclaceae bacterium]|nr:hypothetical protein [Rhodocyclaceae bacterium]
MLAIVAGYALLHATTRLIASANLGEDDPLSNLAAQTLAPGYRLDTGPLYDWLVWLVQTVTGNHGLASFLAIKYALLVVIAGIIFSLTRRLTGSPLWALIAVESMAAVYQIFWRFHEGFTHRVGAMALTLATLWALLRLPDRSPPARRARPAALLGLGLLSEHSVLVFFLALGLAVLPQPSVRRTLFSLRFASWLALSLLIAAPYLYWLSAAPGRWMAFFVELIPPVTEPTLPALANGIKKAIQLPIEVLSPWLLIALATFPQALRPPWRPAHQDSPQALIGRLLAIELILLFVFGGIVFAHTDYAVHSLLPLMIPAIPWLTARLAASAPSERRIRAYAWILFVFTLIAYTVRAGN